MSHRKIARKKRTCEWPGNDARMLRYHDTEWGVPVHRDRKIFEFLVLESAQAGLSWRTVLHKRRGYKNAFVNFDPKKVALFSNADVRRLLRNPAIIRNRLKIAATIHNARLFLDVQKEYGSFAKYMWEFVGCSPIDGKRKKLSDLPARTKQGDTFAADLKKRGFKFLGPTVLYAHMQAVGMVNDHVMRCFRHGEIKRLS